MTCLTLVGSEAQLGTRAIFPLSAVTDGGEGRGEVGRFLKSPPPWPGQGVEVVSDYARIQGCSAKSQTTMR